MRSSMFQKSLALALIIFFINVLCFQEQSLASENEKNGKNPSQPAKYSAWRDNSPKGTSLTPVLLVGAAVVGAFIIIKILKKDNNDDKKDEGKDEKEKKGSASLQSDSFSESNLNLSYSSDIGLRLQPYFAPGSSDGGSMKLQTLDKSFQLGISITF